VVLEHSDPALSLSLFASADRDEIVAEWQSWSRVLGLPLLVADADGSLREPFATRGADRNADLAPPPAFGHRPPPSVAADAPPAGEASGYAGRLPRRARDHRAGLARFRPPA